jgi:hypothetical protein
MAQKTIQDLEAVQDKLVEARRAAALGGSQPPACRTGNKPNARPTYALPTDDG